MAWTAPRTWVASEVVTAALYNAHLSANHEVLKTAFDDTGKLRGLSSSYVADLSGANVTGLAYPGGANTYTAGKQNFNGGATARVVIPVGADLYDGAPGNKTAGSFWVEGEYLHWVSATQVEWRFLGNIGAVAPAGAVVGSVWGQTDTGTVHYIDADGDERYVPSSYSPHTDGAAVSGSLWVDTDYIHFSMTSGIEYQGHVDTHTDGTVHSDVTHVDTHTDSHSDVTHVDTAHADTHVDHTDGGHADAHGDVAYGDTAHTDTYTDTHSDTAHADHSDHGDVAHDDRPESLGV